MPRQWTHLELDTAQRRRLDGERTMDIAADFGVSPKCLAEALRRQGHPPGARWRPWEAQELADAHRRLSLAHPIEAVAADLGATVPALRAALVRRGYPAVIRPERSLAQTRRLVRDYLRRCERASTARVAFALDRTYGATARLLRRLRRAGVVRVCGHVPGRGGQFVWELVPTGRLTDAQDTPAHAERASSSPGRRAGGRTRHGASGGNCGA